MKNFDHIVIGSGIAGLTYALKTAESGSVAIVTKRARATTNTAWAQGGVACVTSREDSFKLHGKDTMDAGVGLCHEDVVDLVVQEGPERIKELIELGMSFDLRQLPDGGTELDLGREGGHSKRRILHAHDFTGQEIQKTLLDAVEKHPSIQVMEDHMAVDLITSGKLGYTNDERVVGLYVLDEKSGCVLTLRSDRIVLASGGCGKVYLYTTNPDIASGDGVAMAWRAGAAVSNMEFIQFHPTCLFHPEAKSFLISEAVRGEGGILINEKGEPLMDHYHSLKSLAPRDIVARAIDAEMKRTGAKCVYLDITGKTPEFLRQRFPKIYQTCANLGIDIATQPIPVVPAAHYQCGGVKTNEHGETTLPGLFAIGEVACTGLHGANRLASNSLLEALVFAGRACAKATQKYRLSDPIQLPEWRHGSVSDVDELVVIYHNWDEIRRLMWDYVGIVRTDKRLQRAATRLRNLEKEVQDFYWNFKVTTDLLELRNLVTVASLIVDSALSRKESRGLHFTLDYPQADEHFLRDSVIQRG